MKIGLIGAENVGKSTLFNRLIGQFRAIVTDIPWTTIDILSHDFWVEDKGKLTFLDSPGLSDFSEEIFFIQKNIQEADLLLFVIDDAVGISAKEEQIYEMILEYGKKDQTFLVVNKLDVRWKDHEHDLALSDYYQFGFDQVIGVSAKKERNISTLEDAILHYFSIWLTQHPDHQQDKWGYHSSGATKLAIVWKPNSGKSTLLNTLVGKELAKVEDKLGTTRDYIVGQFSYRKKDYEVYDTAGIRKKWNIRGIEKIAYDKTLKMLEYVRPLVVFLVDSGEGITHRDMTLLEEINRLGLPIIFCLNKADLLEKKELEAFLKVAQSALDFAKHIPIIPLIATDGTGVGQLMKMLGMVDQENKKRISTNALNTALLQEQIQRPARFPKNRICKILYATQIEIDAPTFLIFVNHKERVNFAFRKWVENSLRRNFWFVGVPLVLRFRERGEGNEDRPMPWVSLRSLKKEERSRQEKISKNQNKILEQRKKKKEKK